jgi:hypothetical protein
MSEIKDKFHKLISEAPDNEKLKYFFDAFKLNFELNTGDLMSKLSISRKADLKESYLQSFDESKLISFEEVKNKYF